MSDGQLQDLVRYVGLLVSLLGAFIVNPAATVDLVRRSRRAVANAARSAGRYLGLLAPVHHEISVGSGIGTISSVGTATASGYGWSDSDTPDQKIERLRARIDQVDELLRLTRDEARAGRQAAERALAETRAQLQQALAELEDRVRRGEQAALAMDRRALPVVGVGVLLSGAAEEISSSVWVAWPLMVVAAGLAVYAVVDARRARQAS